MLLDDHEHDWDSLVFIVFDREDLSEPVEVRMSHHLFISSYSWDEVEKIDGTHVVAYVALGSHGAYSSPMTVPEYDSWESGGPLYGPDSFNWYLVWDCIEHVKRVVSGREQTFCNVTHKLISGKEQYEPIEGLWPREFTGDAHYLFVYVLHSSDSPWHDDRWFETRPKGPLQVLEFSVFCSVDMHIYDPLGRHIGTNYTTGERSIDPKLHLSNRAGRAACHNIRSCRGGLQS